MALVSRWKPGSGSGSWRVVHRLDMAMRASGAGGMSWTRIRKIRRNRPSLSRISVMLLISCVFCADNGSGGRIMSNTSEVLMGLLETMLRDNYPLESKDDGEGVWRDGVDCAGLWIDRVRAVELRDDRLVGLIRAVSLVGQYQEELVDAIIGLACGDC